MDILDSVCDLAIKHINSENSWYNFNFNEKILPDGINNCNGSWYKKNVELKKSLHHKWKHGDELDKEHVIKYFIVEWGGIKGNRLETIKRYSNNCPDRLISLGKSGVASWSKALSIYNPNEYAIFDARVSTSLNALQILSAVKHPSLYPILPSQNNRIKEGMSLFRNHALINGWLQMTNDNYYSTYISLLKQSVLKISHMENIEIYTIEMLLFAFAEELLMQAFPSIN